LSCHPDCEKSSNRALIKLALLSALKTCLEQVDALLQTTTHIHKDARPQTQFRKEPTSAAAAAAAAYCTVSSLCASSSPPLKCGSTPAAPFLPPPSFCTSPHKDCQGGSPYNARAQQHHIGTCTALHTARAQQHHTDTCTALHTAPAQQHHIGTGTALHTARAQQHPTDTCTALHTARAQQHHTDTCTALHTAPAQQHHIGTGTALHTARAQQHPTDTCTALHTARAQQHPASCTSPCNRGVLQREQHSSLVTASAFPCCLLYCHPLCLRPCLTLELALK